MGFRLKLQSQTKRAFRSYSDQRIHFTDKEAKALMKKMLSLLSIQGHRYTAPILRGPESPGDSYTNLKNHDLNVEDCLDELEPRPFLFVCLFVFY